MMLGLPASAELCEKAFARMLMMLVWFALCDAHVMGPRRRTLAHCLVPMQTAHVVSAVWRSRVEGGPRTGAPGALPPKGLQNDDAVSRKQALVARAAVGLGLLRRVHVLDTKGAGN